ncbi:MAG: hypothetical protein K6T85_06505 [Gorillibacterium sp.]|nr:hypothetical protein [Gorillibacterium sp.]
MMRMLAGVGLISLVLVVLYSVKKIYDYRDLRMMETTGYYEDYDIYKAAQTFAQGASVDVIEEMLSKSYEFDPKRIEQTLTLALPERNNSDGGYSAFIQAVNQVLGEEVYNKYYHPVNNLTRS